MTANREVTESGRKRARTEEASCTSTSLAVLVSNNNDRTRTKASASDVLRANKISNKLSILLKEFPEMKFIIDFENLQAIIEAAVVKYEEEKETKKHNAQVLMNYGQEISPLYSLPDEVLSNCLSYVGKGYYGVVGLVSKKLHKAYKKEFGGETAYLEMATSANLANHCINELCNGSEERDEILRAAAVNGNLDILRAAVKDGYDLFPLVAMKKRTVEMNKETIYLYDDSDDDDSYDSYCDSVEKMSIYYTDECERMYSLKPKAKVKLSKLVERGHLHVLKYLHEEINYFLGLQRYCKPAIEHGKLEILQWLKHIGVMDNGALRIGFMENQGNLQTNFDYCECAIKSGHVEILKWLQEVGRYAINTYSTKVLVDSIRTKSTEMIQYCFDLGYDNLNANGVDYAIKLTKSVEVFRLMYELGYQFGEIREWLGYEAYRLTEEFEIIKFLRSISVPWCGDCMSNIVTYGTLEMIQYAHEDGCPWTTHGGEYYCLLSSKSWRLDTLNYLIQNGCKFDYEHRHSSRLISVLIEKKELGLLDNFIGENFGFDNRLLREIFKCSKPWFEGISYMLENGKDVEIFTSLEEVFDERRDIDGIKYFYSLGLPWCLDSTKNTHFLSQIACYIDLEDVKWAYENGCNGGDLVPYVEKEWREIFGIRHRSQWKASQAFFEENELLDEAFLEKSGLKKLHPKNIQETGDAQLSSYGYLTREDSFFEVDFGSLKNLVDRGFKFTSESEKESVCKEAYERCCGYSQYEEDYRKRLALFVSMGVRDL